MELRSAIIVDLDGTLCDHRHRLHFVDSPKVPINTLYSDKEKRWKPDYESFYAAMSLDESYEWCSEIIANLSHYYLLFVTGRPEKYWNETIYWLDRHDIPTDEKYMKLFMRPDFLPCTCTHSIEGGPYGPVCCMKPDHRPAHEIKREIYEREIRDKYDVLFALEDDEKCCEMYKGLGLTVLRVI